MLSNLQHPQPPKSLAGFETMLDLEAHMGGRVNKFDGLKQK